MVNQIWYKLLRLASWLTILVIFPFNQHRVLAQITPDTTLGAESSRVTRDVEVRGALADLIEGGAGRGTNHFHSFTEFNVEELQRVYFANPAGIENILTRVTGTNPSNIFGTLGVDGAANLFLLNPHGIVFGVNAQLDIEGSFVASTANSLTFEDGSAFSAANPGDASLLTISVPLGLQYGTNQTGVITNRGNLSGGQDLTLSAGNLDLQGQLSAGRNLTLEAQDTVKIRDSASVPFLAVAGEQLLVQGNQAVDIFALNHPDSGLFSGGDMVLRSGSSVLGDAHYWSGGSFRIEQLDGSLGDLESPNDPVIRTVGDVLIGGYIGASLHIIAGGKVEIPNFILITGADPVNGLQENVTLSDGTIIAIDGRNEPTLDIRAGVDPAEIGVPFFSGTGNDLFFGPIGFTITPTSADIQVGSIFFNETTNLDAPLAGRVLLTNQYRPNPGLTGNIQVDDTFFGVAIETIGLAGGGSVDILSKENITLNGQISASALDIFSGNGGDVRLVAEGDITLNQGSNISSNGLLGGNITFNSKEDISIADSLIRSNNFTDVAGVTGGEIKVTANSLFLTEGSVLFTSTAGMGNAGAVKITATDLVHLDGESNNGIISTISSLVDFGAEGNSEGIELKTPSLELTNGAIVSTSTFGSGDAGGIELKTSSLEMTNGAIVDASTFGIGNAGAVKITATDSIRLDGEDNDGIPSHIFSIVDFGAKGDSGGIELTTATLELTNGAQVSASTFGIGDAGAVNITATDSVRLDGESNTGNTSNIFSQVAPGAEGNSEGIELTTSSLELTNGAGVSASTFGIGNAGAVKITAIDSVRLNGESNTGNTSNISSTVEPGARGNSEGIELTTGSLELTNGAQVSTSTLGIGDAGLLEIKVTDSVRLDGESNTGNTSNISSQVSPEAKGNSEGIELTTATLELTNGAGVSASTFGIGDAGAVKITATELVRLDGELSNGLPSAIFSQVAPGAKGNSEGIELTTATLELTNGAGVDASTFGLGNAGAVKITATDSVRLDGEDNYGIPSSISSVVGFGAEGNSEGIELTTATLELTNGAGVDASTFGLGNAGVLNITATDSVQLDGESSNGIPSSILSKVDLVAEGNSGGIELTTSSLELTNGAEVSSSTFGIGNTGAVKITAADSVRLDGESSDGFSSGIFSQVVSGAKGNSEGIELTTATLELTNGAQVDASTFGVGNAGAVKITSTDSVRLDGESSDGFSSGIFSEVFYRAEGSSGGIDLTTTFLEMTNGAEVSASTFGFGNAGAVKVTATNSVHLDGESSIGIPSRILSTVELGARGNSEGIKLTTASLELTNGAVVSASTFGVGNAGAVKITATDSVRLDGDSDGFPSAIFSQVAPRAEGNSGGIELTTTSLELLNGANVNTSTFGVGNAGAVKITATNSVLLDGESKNGIISAILSEVFPGAEGNSGKIELTTASLELTNGTQVSASTGGIGDAGVLNITATDSVRLDGESSNGFSSGIFSLVVPEAEGNSMGIELTTASLELTNGAIVSASTFGLGNAGAVKITAIDSVRLDGESSTVTPSSIFSTVESGAKGESRGIELITTSLELTNGAQVSASTSGIGDTGLVKINATDSVRLDGELSNGFSSAISSQVNSEAKGESRGIDLTTSSLELTNGATVSASTSGIGDAGDIFVRNAQSVFLDNNSSISTAVEPTSRGTGGNINIQTNSLTLDNNSQISARSQAPGKAGDINLNVSETLTATDSDITTSSTQSAGGAINITAKDIRLRGDSDITTSVFSGIEDGGNITITTDSLIAFADSDILAFARDGRGGDITFVTPIFFGFAFRPAPKGTDPATLDHNNRVDINASGAVDGVITLPNLDFIQNSLTELPDNLIDTDSLLANSCIVRTREQEGKFIITGGGSLPNRPGDSVSSPYPTGVVRMIPSETPPRPWQKGDPIIQATGVYQLPDGRLVMSRECP
ncbi:MAG: filamentous hemagglutinin N-terminal domain-containing protein [Symploca sp. SIO2E6]|nr:filamentous hemagglutinin N-terminal domain-containing protein [Symploca sp. SIO2E6]